MSVGDPARIRAGALVIDCNDLDREVAFWSSLLEMKVASREDDWADLEPLGDAGPVLSFQRVPEGKQAKNRLHLDFLVDDLGAASRRARQFGARSAGRLHNPAKPWQVWRDPEGNEFCFCTSG